MSDDGRERCPSCEELVDPASDTCPSCGASLGYRASETSLLTFAVSYPATPGWMPTILGGVVGFFAAIFILPIVLLWGYRYRLSRAAARDDRIAPEFDDFEAILLDGVYLVGAFLPFVLGATVLFVGGALVLTALGSVAGAPETLAGVLFLAYFLLFFVAAYVGAAIHPTYVATGSIPEVYEEGRFLRVAATSEYFVGFVLLLVTRFALAMAMLVAAVVSILTLVGPIVVYSAWYAYDEYLAAAVWGHVARQLAERGTLPEVAPDDPIDR